MIIIGAGVAGSFCSYYLSRRGRYKVLLLEAENRVGGRVRTATDGGIPLYEEGAWRIPVTHRRYINFGNKMGAHWVPVASESIPRTWIGAKVPEKKTSGDTHQCLSTWTELASSSSPEVADRIEAGTGYSGIYSMAAGTNSYEAEAPEAEEYMIPHCGLQHIWEEAVRRAGDHGAHLEFESRVTDVVRISGPLYKVTYVRRVGSNSFATRDVHGKSCIICCPPRAFTQWPSTQEDLKPVAEAVGSLPLIKVFSDSADILAKAIGTVYHCKSDTLHEQLISPEYPNNWTQLAYAGGRRAEAVEELRLCGEAVRGVCREVSNELGLSPEDEKDLHTRETRILFWKDAVHYWKPFPGLDADKKCVEASVLPSPRLPGVFIAGEALSNIQGWGEGALRTAIQSMKACEGFLRTGEATIPRSLRGPCGAEVVRFNGRIVDVSRWKRVHPGSEKAILNHLDQDVSDLFRSKLHPDYAYALMFVLQCAVALSTE